MKFLIPDMSCGHCVATIEKAVKAKDPVATVNPDLSSHTVEIISERSETEIAQVLEDAGYPATPAGSVEQA